MPSKLPSNSPSPAGNNWAEGEALVGITGDKAVLEEAIQAFGGSIADEIGPDGEGAHTYLVRWDDPAFTVEQAIEILGKESFVKFAQPNFRYGLPADPEAPQ